MVANADGFEKDVRLQVSGNQGIVAPTHGGTRFVYMRDAAAVPHLLMATLDVSRPMAGAQLGSNDVATAFNQSVADGSGTRISVPKNTTIDFPAGADQEIVITTPIDPVTPAQLPSDIDAIPVVREFGPDGTTFSNPVEVTIAYTDAEVAGMDESALRVFRYNPGTGVFDTEITTIVNRDLAANTITFTLGGFSTYGLGAPTVGLDTDDDGTTDSVDPDDDNDGNPDLTDPFPLDTDNDGQDNNVDSDDDADGIPDVSDLYLLDTDNDGLSNAVDTDDDNDGIPDDVEISLGSDPLNPSDVPSVPVGRYIWFAVATIVVLGTARIAFDQRAKRRRRAKG